MIWFAVGGHGTSGQSLILCDILAARFLIMINVCIPMLVVAEWMTPRVTFVLDEYTNSDSLLENSAGLP